jgi:hypothetical protein
MSCENQQVTISYIGYTKAQIFTKIYFSFYKIPIKLLKNISLRY